MAVGAVWGIPLAFHECLRMDAVPVVLPRVRMAGDARLGGRSSSDAEFPCDNPGPRCIGRYPEALGVEFGHIRMTFRAFELSVDGLLESAGINVHADHCAVGCLNREVPDAVAKEAFVRLLSRTQARQEENAGAKLDY